MNETAKIIQNVYEVAGALGVLALAFIFTVGFSIKIIRKYAIEAKTSRNEAMVIQQQMTSQLRQLLEDCERTCREKDSTIIEKDGTISMLRDKIDMLTRNESYLRSEIASLHERVRFLENQQ